MTPFWRRQINITLLLERVCRTGSFDWNDLGTVLLCPITNSEHSRPEKSIGQIVGHVWHTDDAELDYFGVRMTSPGKWEMAEVLDASPYIIVASGVLVNRSLGICSTLRGVMASCLVLYNQALTIISRLTSLPDDYLLNGYSSHKTLHGMPGQPRLAR